MITKKITIPNKLGLHARAAAQLVKVVERFDAEVMANFHDMKVNCTSIMGLMMLTAGQGEEIIFQATGPEEQLAINSINELVNSNFHEPA